MNGANRSSVSIDVEFPLCLEYISFVLSWNVPSEQKARGPVQIIGNRARRFRAYPERVPTSQRSDNLNIQTEHNTL